MSSLEESILTLDEFEAIRLIDFQEIPQEEAAKKMQISQPTLSRILKSSRKKISDAIINGKAIKIQGDNFKMVQPQKKGLRRGAGRGEFAAGPDGECVCPKCGYKKSHVLGQPCYQIKCPKCKSLMTRKQN